MATKAKKQAETDQTASDAGEAASLDAAQQTIKALLKLGKDRGFVTHDELIAALPAEDYTSEQIDDVMSTLNEMGVSVVDPKLRLLRPALLLYLLEAAGCT